MASRDSLELNSLRSKGIVRQVGTDTPIAIRLRYIGTGTVTSVVVTTATSVVLTTSDGGTDTYLFSAYTTIGALADAINADGIFEAKVWDCLRSLGSDDNLVASAGVTAVYDFQGNSVYNLYLLTAVDLQFGVCISPLMEFDAPKGHVAKLQEIKYYATITGAADSVQVWKRKGTVETQVYSALSVNNTATTINWASGEGFLSGEVDGDLVVLLKDAAMTDATTNYLRIAGIIE